MDTQNMKTYRCFPSRLKSQMEITPELINLTSFDHPVDDIDCIPGLSLLAHVVAPKDFCVVHVALAHEVVNHPFVEVVAPVCEGVSELGLVLAVSGESHQYLEIWKEYNVHHSPAKIESSFLVRKHIAVSISLDAGGLLVFILTS